MNTVFRTGYNEGIVLAIGKQVRYPTHQHKELFRKACDNEGSAQLGDTLVRGN